MLTFGYCYHVWSGSKWHFYYIIKKVNLRLWPKYRRLHFFALPLHVNEPKRIELMDEFFALSLKFRKWLLIFTYYIKWLIYTYEIYTYLFYKVEIYKGLAKASILSTLISYTDDGKYQLKCCVKNFKLQNLWNKIVLFFIFKSIKSLL